GAEVAARDAPADPGEDLVADRPARRGQVASGLRRAGLVADDDYLVALARAVDVRDIQHHQVHADASGETDVPPADQDAAGLRGDPRDAVAVADGHRGDAAIARKAVLVSVRDARAGGHARDALNPRAPGQRGMKLKQARQVRGGVQTVDREAGTDRVHSV